MSIIPRPYQLELLEKGKESNSICVLPTGSGKTLISCLLISYIKKKEENKNKKSIFLVPTRPLVTQQKDHIVKYLERVGENYTVGAYGSNSADIFTIDENVSEVRSVDWQLRDIYVSTPQMALNALQHSELRIEDIDLIVFDECHHARGDHPYRLIMSEFYKICEESKRPRILGLTASVVLTLKAFNAEMRVLELNLDSKIKNAESFIEGNCTSVELKTYINDITKMADTTPIHIKCANDIGDWCFDILKILNSSSNNVKFNDKQMMVWNLFAGESADAAPPPHSLPPITAEDLGGLKNRTRLLIETLEEWEGVDGTQFKGIIFCKERIKVVLLSLLLLAASRDFPKLKYLRISPFMSNTSMSKSTQAEILEKFRKGEINTLISTSVLEEGLDVPECNVVIRYDLDDNLKGMIQSKGRARAENSVFILLCPHNDPNRELYISELSSFYSVVSNAESVETEDVKRKQAHQEVLASQVYVVPSTGAKVTITGAKNILSQFVNLRVEDRKKGCFKYNESDKSLEIPEESEAGVCRVSIEPGELPPGVSWKKFLDLKLIRSLHESGDIDDNLNPIKITNRTLLEEIMGYHSHSYGTLKAAPFCVPKALKMPWKQVDPTCYNELYYSFKYEVFGVLNKDPPEWEHSCTLFRERKEKINYHGRIANRMCLLTPEKLDDTVERLEFFGNEEKIKTKLFIRYMGEGPQLTSEQIKLGDKFNIWAFGEWKKQNAIYTSFKENTKHYFVFPFCLSKDKKDEIDWERAKDVVQFNETYNKEYIEELEKGGPFKFLNNPSAIVDIENNFTKDILLYTPYSNPRGLFGPRFVSKRLTPASFMRSCNKMDDEDDDGSLKGGDYSDDDDDDDDDDKGEEKVAEADDYEIPSKYGKRPQKWNDDKYQKKTYEEYYRKRYNLGISDMSQKLIYSARGDMVPELCRVFPLRRRELNIVYDLKKRMWRVEFALSCVEFKNNPAFRDEFSGLSIEDVARAFTSTSASPTTNYENLEFFGDTAVKFCVVTNLFLYYPTAREKTLVKHKNILVSNRLLAEHAQEVGLDALIVTGSSANGVNWVPPSMVSSGERVIGLKMIADVFEAVTGLSSLAPFCLDNSDDDKGLFLSAWDKARDHLWKFNLREVGTFNQVRRSMEAIISKDYTYNDLKFLMEKGCINEKDLCSAELKLRYKFGNKALLCEAIIHESCSIGRGYQRLEFLGDAVVDAIVTKYLFSCYPEMSPYIYSELRRSIVQNTSLAWVIVANKLHQFLHFRDEKTKATLEKYIITLKSRGYSDPAHPPLSPWEDLGSPKIFGDLFESLVGAIYMDLRGDMVMVNEVVLPFLMPLLSLIKDPKNPDISPVSKMAQRIQLLDIGSKIHAEASPCKNGDIRVEFSLKNKDSDEYIFKLVGESTTRQMAQFNAAKKVLEWLDEHEDFVNEHTRK